MLIYGHKLIKGFEFCWIEDESFQKNAINCFVYDESLIEKAKNVGVEFAILAKNEDETLLANALGAKFILFNDSILAKKASKMAEFYLFDSKILLIVTKLKKLDNAYKIGVDGVILREIIKQE